MGDADTKVYDLAAQAVIIDDVHAHHWSARSSRQRHLEKKSEVDTAEAEDRDFDQSKLAEEGNETNLDK